MKSFEEKCSELGAELRKLTSDQRALLEELFTFMRYSKRGFSKMLWVQITGAA